MLCLGKKKRLLDFIKTMEPQNCDGSSKHKKSNFHKTKTYYTNNLAKDVKHVLSFKQENRKKEKDTGEDYLIFYIYFATTVRIRAKQNIFQNTQNFILLPIKGKNMSFKSVRKSNRAVIHT